VVHKAGRAWFHLLPDPGVLDLDRDHVAFRVDIVRADNKPLTVSVYAHESCSADEGLYRSPAMLFIDGTEGLVLGDLLKLNAVLREAKAVCTRTTRGRARAVLREGPAAARVCRGAGETDYTSYLPDTGVNLVELASPMVRINDDLSLHLSDRGVVLRGHHPHPASGDAVGPRRRAPVPPDRLRGPGPWPGADRARGWVGAPWRVSDDLSAPCEGR